MAGRRAGLFASDHQLAELLAQRREAILRAWADAVLADPSLVTASALSRAQFRDHIPTLLAAFEERLRRGDAAAGHAEAADHGLLRWQQGYALREVVQEWKHLQLAVLAEIDRVAAEHAALAPARAVRVLAELCGEGVAESVGAYAELQQAEARGRVRDLERALAALEQMDRVRAQAWREAAHDLRGNVGLVANASEILGLAREDAALSDRYLATLRDGVASLRALIDDLMDLARLEAGLEVRQIAPFDAASLLRKLIDGMAPSAAEKQLALSGDGPASLPVAGDAVKVARIATNLLQNAIRYTERGGVHVAWEQVAGADPERWALSIADTGPGLPHGAVRPGALVIEAATSEAESVGAAAPGERPTPPPEPGGSETRERDAGEGIGLSIVKRLCELLDATIELTTEPGRGATFRIVLPVRYD